MIHLHQYTGFADPAAISLGAFRAPLLWQMKRKWGTVIFRFNRPRIFRKGTCTMSRFCIQCGTPVADEAKFCSQCGASLPTPAAPKPAPAPAPMQPPQPVPVNTAKPPKKKAKKKKGCLVALIITLVVLALVAFLVFAAGNYLSLRLHTNKVLDSLNSGNMDLSQFQVDPYKDLPLYVIEMMGEAAEPAEVGPVVSAMAPHLTFDRIRILDFLGTGQVEYRILSRDLSGWILSLDYASITSPEQLQQMLLDYIPKAPLKEYFVTVTYYNDGLFRWKGNYETPEFANAISGGLNTAFNALYEKMMEEMEDVLG